MKEYKIQVYGIDLTGFFETVKTGGTKIKRSEFRRKSKLPSSP